MRKFINICFLFLVLAPSVSAQQMLDTYLVTAANNNPGLKARFNEYQAALEKVPQVGALPDPQVMFGYFIQPVETRLGPQKARISLTQRFPWFGTLAAKKDAAGAAAQAKYEAFEDARSNLFYNVRSTYYNLYVTGKAIGITMDNLEILNSFRSIALVKIESGLTSTVDGLRLEMEIGDMENQLAYLKDNYQTLQVAFNNLLNADQGQKVLLPDTLLTVEPEIATEAIMDSITLQNHQLRQLDNMLESYQAQELAAKKMGKPGFSVGIDYMVIGNTDASMAGNQGGKDAIVFPTVGISIPLYRKKYNAMVQEASLMQQATENKKADKVNMLNTIYSRTNRDLQDGKRRVALYHRQLGYAKKSLSILESSYSTDGKNFEEVLRMERKVLKYALELEKARADQNAAAAFINYLTGN
jgi:outer membrane protein TolC